MSIDEIMKKSKLSLDEMHDTKDVGNPEIRTEKRTEDNKSLKKRERKEYHFPSCDDGMMKRNMNFKLTFNVNEDTFLAFNEIYAKRMLDGNKTEKSVLICEAIKLLYEKEER
jgi:hypothetical protein